MVVVRVVAFCIIIARIFVILSQRERERERERDVRRVIKASRRQVRGTLSFSLFLPILKILFLYLSLFDFFLFLD